MKVLLLGKTGLLGYALHEKLNEHFEVAAPSHAECDVTQPDHVEAWIEKTKPDIVINATGSTNVDAAEDHPDEAFRMNRDAVASLVSLLSKKNIIFVHFSTDYVFDGVRQNGYAEDAVPSPLNIYGKSKLEGEAAVLSKLKKFYLIRTSWLFGPHGKNFVDTMLRLAQNGKPISVVNDQKGNPTYTFDLAQAVLTLLSGKPFGIYHIVNEGSVSWYEFSREIFQQLGVPQKINAITSEQLNRRAKRPPCSILKNTKLPPLRNFRDALEEYLMNQQLILTA